MLPRKLAAYAFCLITVILAADWGLAQSQGGPAAPAPNAVQRDLLYVSAPGRTNDIGVGGVGVLVFDINRNFRFVKRIATWDFPASRDPEDMKGISASPANGLFYVSTSKRLAAFDLATEQKVWEQTYDGQCCDRMSVTQDGKMLWVPAGGARRNWFVVDAMTGTVIKKIDTPQSLGSHNTVISLDGSRVFMEGSSGKNVTIADAKTQEIVKIVGPFSANVRPFTINGSGSLIFANVNDLLGFEVADVKTGKVIHRVEVAGYGWTRDRIRDHNMPGHGIALSPDEKELWVADGVNGYLHVFDATVMPPKQVTSIKTRTLPFWVTFGIDGKYVFPSSGDVIDAHTKQIVGGLKDEAGRQVESEKLMEIQFANGKAIRVGDSMAVGQVRGSATN